MSGDSDEDGPRCARFDLAANAPAVLVQIYMSAGGMTGPETVALRPGQSFYGVSFEAMAARGSGWLIVRGNRLVIHNITDDPGRN